MGQGETCRDLIEDPDWLKALAPPEAARSRRRRARRRSTSDYTVEVSGKRFDVRSSARRPRPARTAPARRAQAAAPPSASGGGGAGGGDALVSPMQGTVLRVLVEQGADGRGGRARRVVEAMKMENEITAHKAGTVSELPIEAGARSRPATPLAVITDPA